MRTSLSRQEALWGWIYLIFQMTVLPTLLTQGNQTLPHPLNSSELNFLFFLLNFLAVAYLFRGFLKSSWSGVSRKPGRFWAVVALGFLGYLVASFLYQGFVACVEPGYVNLNDQGIGVMAGRQFLLMTIGTVILVPPVEECFYRGLIFGNLCRRNAFLAYTLSASLFSLIHIMGFLTAYSGMELLLSFFQYIPAGLILAYAYQRSGTIFAPIFIHALVNLRGIWLMR